MSVNKERHESSLDTRITAFQSEFRDCIAELKDRDCEGIGVSSLFLICCILGVAGRLPSGDLETVPQALILSTVPHSSIVSITSAAASALSSHQ